MLTDADEKVIALIKSIGRRDGKLPLYLDDLLSIIDRQAKVNEKCREQRDEVAKIAGMGNDYWLESNQELEAILARYEGKYLGRS